MRLYIKYLRECYLIIKCLIIRNHKLKYEFVKNFSKDEMLQLAHCTKCNRYWV
jgi:hypothetical protein